MLVSFFCRMGMASEDSAFVGHITKTSHHVPQRRLGAAFGDLGSLALSASVGYAFVAGTSDDDIGPKAFLAAAGLSDMVTSLLIIPPLAFNQSLNALVGQAMGSGNKKMAGTWLLLSVFWLTIGYIPMLICFFFVGDILHLLGFDAKLCGLANSYAKFNVFWPIPNGWYQCMRFYFQAQGITRPAMYNNIAFLGVNALLNWIFVFGGPFRGLGGWQGFGFIGAAISLSCSRSMQPLAYWLYMFVWKRAHLETWPGMSSGFLKAEHQKKFMAMSLPQIGTLILQAAIGQSTTLLISQLGEAAIASSAAVAAVTQVFTGGLTAALSSVGGIRVGYYLGKGDGVSASRAGWLSIGIGSAAVAVIAVFVLPLGKILMGVVTSSDSVQDLGFKLLPAVLLNTLASIAVNVGTGGILTSQGRVSMVTCLSMGFELPLSLGSTALLVLVFKSNLVVVYWAQAIVSVLEAGVVCFIVTRSDWGRYAREARVRQNAEEDDSEPTGPGTSLVVVTDENNEKSSGGAPSSTMASSTDGDARTLSKVEPSSPS